MELRLVNKERLTKYGKIVTSIINGKKIKELHLPLGIHTTTKPIIDNSKEENNSYTF